MIPFTTRAMRESDKNYILSAWLKSYRDHISFRACPNEIFFREHHKLIESIMKKSETEMIVNPDDEEHFYGFITHGDKNVHFIYIKNVYRKLGIASRILKNLRPEDYSHETYATQYLKKYFSGSFNPYLAWEHYGNSRREA